MIHKKWGKAAPEKTAINNLASCEARQLVVKGQLPAAQAALALAKANLVALLQPYGVAVPSGPATKETREDVFFNLQARAGQMVSGAHATIVDMDGKIASLELDKKVSAVEAAEKEVERLNNLVRPSLTKKAAVQAALALASKSLLSAVELAESIEKTRTSALDKQTRACVALETFSNIWRTYADAKEIVAKLNAELQMLAGRYELLDSIESAKLLISNVPTQAKTISAIDRAKAVAQRYNK